MLASLVVFAWLYHAAGPLTLSSELKFPPTMSGSATQATISSPISGRSVCTTRWNRCGGRDPTAARCIFCEAGHGGLTSSSLLKKQFVNVSSLARIESKWAGRCPSQVVWSCPSSARAEVYSVMDLCPSL